MKLLKIKNQDSEIRPREEWPNTEEGQLLLDVYQDEKNIYIKSTIAGVNPQDLEIALHNDMLTIKGSRKSEMELEGYDYFFQECYWGDFSRSIILPVEVESAKIGAELKNGVLKITIPKSKKRRKIPIKITE
ncbi:MAG: Hsp20/alpha crystallin family protein [Patescibacteria group bacterium]|jgi:HSP20 family protein|nr:Hsp20/alpha crystallin family protein [Patescibacteria group bacterium]